MDEELAPLPPGVYLVATPIGNLEDLSARAVHVLGACDVVACEDTRRTGRLLVRLGISKPLVSCHEHNEAGRAAGLAARAAAGACVALVSDAGTPGVSDPGYRLVRAAIEAGVAVVPVPGPSSVLAALAASGLPTDRFVFEGFLPAKGAKRLKTLEALLAEERTVVLFESPHRITRLVREIADFAPARPLVLARELTKMHEEILRDTARGLHDALAERKMRGECVLLIGPARMEKAQTPPADEAV